MGKVTYEGLVRGYMVTDTGDISLTVEEINQSEAAVEYVERMRREFRPEDDKDYNARKKPCEYRPGFANYRFTIPESKAKGITVGSLVEVVFDAFNVNKVKWSRSNNRWGPIPEMRYEFSSIRQLDTSRKSNERTDNTEASPQAPAPKSGGK